MKTTVITKIGLTLLIGVFTLSGFAQGYGNGYGRNQNWRMNQSSCESLIPNLSEKQVADMDKLEASHQEKMAELRNERRSTTDVKVKEEIRTRMVAQRDGHRENVQDLLNDEQKEAYAQLHQTGKQKYRKVAYQNGNRRGNGNRCSANFNRGNRKNQQSFNRGNRMGQNQRQGMGRGQGQRNRQFNRNCNQS